jgi:hypothetical protein
MEETGKIERSLKSFQKTGKMGETRDETKMFHGM